MDFSNRTSQPSSGPRLGSVFSPENNTNGPRDTKDNKQKSSGAKGKLHPSKWMGGLSLVVLFGTGLLILALIGWLITSHSNAEGKLVDSNKFQAVFLTNNQVYFGKVNTLNKNYLVLNDIYYLQQQSSGSSATSSSNIQLIKLGCELHKPTDQMVINRDEVEFWENLQSDGQVATAVKNYQSQGSSAQKCSNTTSNSSSVQGTSSTDNGSSSTNNKATNTDTSGTNSTNTNSSNSTNQ